MRTSRWKRPVLALGLISGIGGPVAAQEPEDAAMLPVFSPTLDTAYIGIGIGAFFPVEGQPAPVAQDPDYPYRSNADFQRDGLPPTQRVGDVDNPNLRDWVRDEMQAENEAVIAGKFAYTSRTACRSAGVPGFDVTLSGALFIHQSKDKVTLTFDGNAETRHIWLNVGHSENLRPTGYGESVGHYEGDTLVVDTIGLNDRSLVDRFATPHTEQIHVIERLRVSPDGRTLMAEVTVDDPGIYTMPWSAQAPHRASNTEWDEQICAENNRFVGQVTLNGEIIDGEDVPMPVDYTPDF
jgi:hypothetical protein